MRATAESAYGGERSDFSFLIFCSSPRDQPCSTIEIMTGVRMDTWLWAARFFKTRPLAKRACELGRILSNWQPAQAAREARGPASVAQTLDRETEESRELREKVATEREAMRQFETLPEGRPSKRDRLHIIRFRGRV